MAASTAPAAVTFQVTAGTGTTASVLTGVEQATAIWSSVLADDLTINLTINVGGLDPGVTGVTGAVQSFQTYDAVRTAMIAHATSSDDLVARAHLPAAPAFPLLINRTLNNPNGAGSAVPYVDAPNAAVPSDPANANNNTIRITNANAKALGLLAHDAVARDATITFSSSIAFDYDRSDGISSNQVDFVGIAVHEIGHALGILSGVDVLDRNSTPPDFAPDSQFIFVSPIDLFRYSSTSVASGAIDWTDDTRSKFFSIDGGATSLATFSTGTNYGDGFGASHWKDNLGIGIMDPTFGLGEQGVVTARDLQLLDVVGYQLVPEPGLLGVIGGLAAFMFRRVRRAGTAI
jgi:hypothetical protein